jgi:Na+-driven multidrug efflux pump
MSPLPFIICDTGKDRVPVLPRNCALTLGNYKEILRGGIPSLLRQGLLSLSTMLLNQAAGPYGDGVIAAISIVQRVFFMASSALIGFGQGFQPVCGFNYGAKQYHQKRVLVLCSALHGGFHGSGHSLFHKSAGPRRGARS